MSFEHFGLEAEILRAVREQGYEQATPIQEQAIPVILEGHDLMGGAQTGTGKTAGFTLPLLNRLVTSEEQPQGRPVRALVLTPTRELAAQVGDSVKAYGRHLSLSSTIIFGGVNIRPQTNTLRRGVDIVVATPGRLLDHAQQGNIDLSQVEVLVLDEADRMLDMGFIHDIRRIIRLLPHKEQRQNLMFSATFSHDIKRLASDLLTDPRLIEVAGTNTTADSVSQLVHPVDKRRKRELLSHLIGSQNWRQVLVFMRTKHGANRLAQQLDRDGLSAAAIHGNKSQGARTRALREFKKGETRVLVATDIAARGLDIDQLPHVVNYELPNVPEDYVHRIGRTGRAGNEGEAVSLVSADEHKQLRDIERLLGRAIPSRVLEGYEPGEAPPDTSHNQQKRPSGPRKQARKQPSRRRRPQGSGSGHGSDSKPGSRSGAGAGKRPGQNARRRKSAQKNGNTRNGNSASAGANRSVADMVFGREGGR